MSRRPAWGPRCPALPAECLKVTQNPSLIPGSTSPPPMSSGLASWADRPSEDVGQCVKVRMTLSLDTHWPGDLRQIILLSQSQCPSMLKE